MMGLDARRPQWPHTDPLACEILGPSIRTHDGGEMHGRTIRGLPTRFHRVSLEGVPRVTRRSPNALDRDCSPIEALGCAQCGLPGRYFLRVPALLITMACEVHDQWFHGWSKVFPLQRHSDALTVGVEHGAEGRYRYQSVRG